MHAEDATQTTTASYRREGKINYSSQKRESWYKSWDKLDMWRTIPTFKTTDLNKMQLNKLATLFKPELPTERKHGKQTEAFKKLTDECSHLPGLENTPLTTISNKLTRLFRFANECLDKLSDEGDNKLQVK